MTTEDKTPKLRLNFKDSTKFWRLQSETGINSLSKTSSVRSLPLSEVITHLSSLITSLMMSVQVADLDVRGKQQAARLDDGIGDQFNCWAKRA